MVKGIVSWFDDVKGYGFIEDDNEKTHFVHYSNIQMDGHKVLEKDQRVQFEIEHTSKGTSAVNVSVI